MLSSDSEESESSESEESVELSSLYLLFELRRACFLLQAAVAGLTDVARAVRCGLLGVDFLICRENARNQYEH